MRRAGDDTNIKLSRTELTARGFQPLFAFRRGTEDVSFAADDGAWYRIEAYPEYVRSGTSPPAYLAAPPWEPAPSPFIAAVDRFRAIIQKRKQQQRERLGDADSVIKNASWFELSSTVRVPAGTICPFAVSAIALGEHMETDWREEVEGCLRDFVTVAALARDPILRTEIEDRYCQAPHVPRGLPSGKMAVYAFWHDGTWLKIGKAGPNSSARYVSHHYGPDRNGSTLAGALILDPSMTSAFGFDRDTVGTWMRTNTCRANILLPATRRIELLSLLEAFLHVRLRPRYEGRPRMQVAKSRS